MSTNTVVGWLEVVGVILCVVGLLAGGLFWAFLLVVTDGNSKSTSRKPTELAKQSGIKHGLGNSQGNVEKLHLVVCRNPRTGSYESYYESRGDDHWPC